MKFEKNKKTLMKLLFIIYMCLLIYVVFFAEAMGRTPQGEYVYNLVPLREIKRFWKYIFDNDTLGSIARLNIWQYYCLRAIWNISAIFIRRKA